MAPDAQRKAELEEFKRRTAAVEFSVPELEALAARLPNEAPKTEPLPPSERTTPSLARMLPEPAPEAETPRGPGRIWIAVAVVLVLLAAAYCFRNTALLH